LHEDVDGNPPDGQDALAYADAVKVSIPVMADGSNQVLDATPWSGVARPGKCALSPSMELLACYNGEDDTPGFEAIQAHAGQ
jgi:hypothetical protein